MNTKEFLGSAPKVGQKVFVRVLERVNRVSEDFADEVAIASVGRKYFTLEGSRFADIRFLNESKTEHTKFFSLIKIYSNKKEYEDEKIRKQARLDIETALRYGALNAVDIEDVKLICKILNIQTTQATRDDG